MDVLLILNVFRVLLLFFFLFDGDIRRVIDQLRRRRRRRWELLGQNLEFAGGFRAPARIETLLETRDSFLAPPVCPSRLFRTGIQGHDGDPDACDACDTARDQGPCVWLPSLSPALSGLCHRKVRKDLPAWQHMYGNSIKLLAQNNPVDNASFPNIALCHAVVVVYCGGKRRMPAMLKRVLVRSLISFSSLSSCSATLNSLTHWFDFSIFVC